MRCTLEENVGYEEAESILINQGIDRLGFEVVWEGSVEGESETGINSPPTSGAADIISCENHTQNQLESDNIPNQHKSHSSSFDKEMSVEDAESEYF